MADVYFVGPSLQNCILERGEVKGAEEQAVEEDRMRHDHPGSKGEEEGDGEGADKTGMWLLRRDTVLHVQE